MVLSGEINKNLASLLNQHGAKAIGISGKDIPIAFAPFRSKLIYLTVNAKVFPLPALAFNAKYFSINSFYYISF